MKKIFTILSSAALSAMLSAQVSIGITKAPVSGSLLQLKENETTDDTANATRGLGMPRVKLTSKTNLYPMFEQDGANYKTGTITYTKANEDAKHIGLMVYNTNHCFANTTGLYVWDGMEWQSLKEDEISIEGMVKKLGTPQDAIAPNGVAWHKDHEGNIFFSMNYDTANPTGNTNRWMTTNLATKTYGPRTANTSWGTSGKPTLINSYNSDQSSANACWGYPNPQGTLTPELSTTYDARPILGLLYTYMAATGGQNPSTGPQGNTVHTGVQGICPTGWHLPTDLEWTNLVTEITANASKYSGLPDNTPNSGYAMTDMCEPNIGNNRSNAIVNGGFSALLSGNANGGYSSVLGILGLFWTSSSQDTDKAFVWQVFNGSNTTGRGFTNAYKQHSVRCKKN